MTDIGGAAGSLGQYDPDRRTAEANTPTDPDWPTQSGGEYRIEQPPPEEPVAPAPAPPPDAPPTAKKGRHSA